MHASYYITDGTMPVTIHKYLHTYVAMVHSYIATYILYLATLCTIHIQIWIYNCMEIN